MFLQKYLNEVYYELLLETYDSKYLLTLNEEKFLQIYNLFQSYNFYFIEDIILKYLEVFSMNYEKVYQNIIKVQQKYGNNFVNEIGNNLTILEEFLDD